MVLSVLSEIRNHYRTLDDFIRNLVLSMRDYISKQFKDIFIDIPTIPKKNNYLNIQIFNIYITKIII